MTCFGDDYVTMKCGRKTAVVLREPSAAIAGALFSGEGCTPATEAGRGTVWRFDYPGGSGILRRYLRGGAVRLLWKDAYFLANRPLREFRLHLEVYKQGLPVPKPLGVCWERRGLLVRGALATEALAAGNLHQFLSGNGTGKEEALVRCGGLIRRMHDLHVWHADLQVKNILVGGEGAWLIDFDNAVQRPNLSPLLRARNLLRLRRSLEKAGMPPEYFGRLCDGYGIEALPEWLSRIYAVKGRLSDSMRGK